MSRKNIFSRCVLEGEKKRIKPYVDEVVRDIMDRMISYLFDEGWTAEHALDMATSVLGEADCDRRWILTELYREHTKGLMMASKRAVALIADLQDTDTDEDEDEGYKEEYVPYSHVTYEEISETLQKEADAVAVVARLRMSYAIIRETLPDASDTEIYGMLTERHRVPEGWARRLCRYVRPIREPDMTAGMADGRLTEPSDGCPYDMRGAYDMVKKLQRPLTDDEMKQFRHNGKKEIPVEYMISDIAKELSIYLADEYGMTRDEIFAAILDFNLAQKVRANPDVYKHLTLEQIADRVLRIDEFNDFFEKMKKEFAAELVSLSEGNISPEDAEEIAKKHQLCKIGEGDDLLSRTPG